RGEAGRQHAALDLGRSTHGAIPDVDPHAVSRRRDLDRYSRRRRSWKEATRISEARRRRDDRHRRHRHVDDANARRRWSKSNTELRETTEKVLIIVLICL